MGRFVLSEVEDWGLEHDYQDIRGWPVRDASGKEIGIVQKLIANTDTERVESIVLDTGIEYPADNIELGDNFVLVGNGYATKAGPVVKKYSKPEDYNLWEKRQGFAEYESDFMRHHNEQYGTTGTDFREYRPAYIYGWNWGTAPAFSAWDYATAEPEMRRRYEERHGTGTFEKVKDAARNAFKRARR